MHKHIHVYVDECIQQNMRPTKVTFSSLSRKLGRLQRTSDAVKVIKVMEECDLAVPTDLKKYLRRLCKEFGTKLDKEESRMLK